MKSYSEAGERIAALSLRVAELEAELAAEKAHCEEQSRIIEAQHAEKMHVFERLKMAEMIVDKSPVVLFRRNADEEARLVYFSENIKRIGYTAGDFLEGRVQFKDILYPEDYERVAKEIRAHEAGKEGAYTQYYRIITKDGQTRWIQDQTSVIRDREGNRLFHQGILSDITEQKEAEEALKESRARAEREKETAQAMNRKILNSIRYAEMIQHSILPRPETLRSHLPNSSFLWEPRDIVGGDIYFAEPVPGGFILAVIDCTGHGVPGAFMSMIASSSLRRIIKEEVCCGPADILRRLNSGIKTLLHQDSGTASSDDGLDAAICHIKPNERCLEYSGARLPLVFTDGPQIHVIKGDRQSVGYRRSPVDFDFTVHRVPLEQDRFFYLYTDGYPDQIGGERNRSLGNRHFLSLLQSMQTVPICERPDTLRRFFREHRGENEIQDDVTVVGFGLPVVVDLPVCDPVP